MKWFNLIIICLGIFAILRIVIGLILSNVHQIKEKKRRKIFSDPTDHFFSVVIPAFNEEKTIRDCIWSVVQNSYKKKQIIVVDDGSTDKTPEIIDKLAQKVTMFSLDAQSNEMNDYFDHNIPINKRLIVVHQPNGGKSRALNNALENYAEGDIAMVLDSDSKLASDALEKMNIHFQDRRTIAMSSNVRIENASKFIEYVQETEYLLGYRLKGSEQILDLNYIIGGIGSAFRYSALKEVGFYDTDSITEDIDLTMKLLHHFGNKHYIFGYAEDVIAYTPPVHNFKQLLKQRYRWKYGRFKALFKHKTMIFSHDRQKYSWTLVMWKLPKVFFEEFMMFIDPFMLIWMFWILFHYLDPTVFSMALLLYFVFAIASVLPEDLPTKQKIRMMATAPVAYILMYVINVVDYISLIHCLKNMNRIVHNTDKQANWVSPDR